MLDGRENSRKNRIGAHSSVAYNLLGFIRNIHIEKYNNNATLAGRNRTASEIRF